MDKRLEPIADHRATATGDPSDGGDTGWLLASIWRTRGLVLAAMLLAALALGALLFALRAGLPTLQTFQSSILFVFSGVEKGEYPNGAKFSLSDVAAPAVLQKVYRENKLDSHGLKFEDFASYVSFQPHTQSYDAAVARYRDRLSDRKLTFGERKDIESAMQKELEELRRRGATLRLTVAKRVGIPEDLGRKLLHDIAAAWSSISIEQLGVLDLPESIDAKVLVDLDQLAPLDYPIALEFLIAATERFKSRLGGLPKFELANTIADKESGHTLASLRRAVQDLVDYSITEISGVVLGGALARSPTRTRQWLVQRVKDIETELARAERELAATQAALADMREPSRTRQTEKPGPAPAELPPAGIGQDRSTPMLGERFIDRIIAFVEEGLDKEGRVERRRKEDRLQQKLEGSRARMGQIEDNLLRVKAVLAAQPPAASAQPGPTGHNTVARNSEVEALLSKIAKALNEHWLTAGRFYAAVSPRNLSYDGRLYATVELPRSEAYATEHPIANWLVVSLYTTAVLGVGLMAMLAGLLWQALRPGHSHS